MSAEQFYDKGYGWHTNEVEFVRQKMYHFAEAYAEHCITDKQAQIDKLTKDIESGFMVGAYARLQFLQAAERENAELKTAADSALSSLQSKERETRNSALDEVISLLRQESARFGGVYGHYCAERLEKLADELGKRKSGAESLLSDPAVENILKT